MRELARASPAIARVSSLGCGGSPGSPGGDPAYPVLALEIEAAPEPSALPAAQLVGAIHGDEEIGAELALAAAREILAASGAAALRAGAAARLTVVPVADPWGYEAASRWNASGIDLNRNFPWAWGYESGGGSAPLEAPEAAALAADAAAKRYALSINLHSGAYRICYPWDYVGTSAGASSGTPYTFGDYLDLYSPAHALFAADAAAYGALVESATEGAPGSFPAVQGFDWYFAGGTYADWLYGERGCAAYTVELAKAKSWKARSAAEGEAVEDAHLGAILALLATAGKGAAGRTVDGEGGAVEAKVTAIPSSGASRGAGLPDPVPYSAFAYSGGPDGRFFLPVPPGEWSLEAVALGGGSRGGALVVVREDGRSGDIAIVLR